MPAWGKCYACGTPLAGRGQQADLPAVKPLASFEEGTDAPFTPGGAARPCRSTPPTARRPCAWTRNWVSWDGPQDWTGYDFFKADVYTAADEPARLYVEIRDKGTTDYWTRVNYSPSSRRALAR